MQTQTESTKAKSSGGGAEPPAKEYLAQAVRRAIQAATKQKSSNIVGDAAALLMSYAQEDMRLLRLLTDVYLPKACSNEVNAAMRAQNGPSWYVRATQTVKTVDAAISRAKGAGTIAKRTFMDVVLPGGMQLRHATMSDLDYAANFYIKQSKTMAVRGTAYGFCRELLASKNPKIGDTFGGLVTLEEAERVRDQAEEVVGEVFDV